MSNYEFSDYNLLCINHEGQYLVYNTFSEEILELNKDIYEIFVYKRVQYLINMDNDLIKDWIDRGFIVENKKQQLNKIEFDYGNFVYGGDELQLTILTTNACNFNCVYCYQSHLNSFMETDVQEKIIKFVSLKLAGESFKKIYISWFGGEPLLTKNMVIDMSRKIKEIAKKNHVAYMGQLTSNGYELDLDTFQKLVESNVLYYSITIDGIKEIHNRQRPHKVYGDSYERIMDNLINISKKVKTNRFIVDIRVNLSSDGINDFLVFANIYKKYFGNDKRFHLVPEPIKDWGGRDKAEIEKYTIKQIKSVYDIYEILENMEIDVSNFYNFKRLNHICVAPIKNGYVVDWMGNVHKCDMNIFRNEYYERNKIGSITSNGYLDIDIEKNVNILVRNCSRYHCQECVMYPKCMGIHCVHAIKMMNSDICPIKNELIEYAAMAAKIKFLRRGKNNGR